MPPRRSLRSSGVGEAATPADAHPPDSQTTQDDQSIADEMPQESEDAPQPTHTRPMAVPRRASKFQPKSNSRRSQTERAAQEKAESERQKVRNSGPAGPAENTRGRGGRGFRGGRGDFRGGLSGWRNQAQTQATGFLGSGVAAPKSSSGAKRRLEDDPAEELIDGDVVETTAEQIEGSAEQASNQVTEKTPRTAAGGSKAATGAASKTKGRPTASKSDTDRQATGTAKIKKEEENDVLMIDDGAYEDKISINIDELAYINLISEDEGEIDATGNPRRSFNPVRINRKQHVERKPAIENTASSEISEQVRKEAKAKGVSVSEIQVGISDEGVELKVLGTKSKEQRSKRTRGKAKQTNDTIPGDVKREDDPSLPIVAADPARNTADSSTRTAVDVLDDDDPTDLLPHKLKSRRRYPALFSKPLLQTAEDHAEWDRHERDMRAIAEEFSNDTPTELRTRSAGSHSSAVEQRESTSRRDNKVYLFQLPPVMPNLCTPTEAQAHRQAAQGQEPESTDSTTQTRPDPKPTKSTSQAANTNNNTQETAVKIEDDNNTNTSTNKQGPPLDSATSTPFNLALDASMMPPRFRGPIGTLTVYENGSTELDWAGTPFELNRGVGGMLQETLLVDHESGKASSMSQVAASFIVKPAWDKLLESEE